MMSFSDFSLADDVDQILFEVDDILRFLTSLLSWFWVILAKLAWEFLTNKWVYLEVLWMDSLLWQWRVIVKNIANFGLWFYFVYTVFSAIIWKEEITKKIKGSLLWILVAWIGIQASRFFTAAMIDLSTITLVAAGSLPAQVISQNSDVRESLKKSLSPFVDENFKVTTWIEYSLCPPGSAAREYITTSEIPVELTSLTWDDARNRFIDMLLPSADDVSGPFYYLWLSILNTQFLNTDDRSDSPSVKKTILNTILQWWTSIIYAIEIWVLCILALMRLVYLWMFIVLSPLAVLLRCITKGDKKIWEKIGGDKWFLWSLTKHINFKSFFINIFKPTIIFLWIWLALIFATLMNGLIIKSADTYIDLWWVQIVSKSDENLPNNKSYRTVIRSNIFTYTFRHAGKGILDFMMSILTLVMVYVIIKIAVNMWWWKDFVSEKIGKIQKSVWETLTSLPVMPVAWYDDKTGAPKTQFLNAKQIFGTWSNSVIWWKMGQIEGKIYDEYSKQTNVINWWFSGDMAKTKPLEAGSWREITDTLSNTSTTRVTTEVLTTQLRQIREFGNRLKDKWWLDKGQWYGMILNPEASDKRWQDNFKNWLDRADPRINDTKWSNMVKTRQNLEDTDKSLEKLFETTQYVEAYAELFGLKLTQNTWEYLKHADISRKE